MLSFSNIKLAFGAKVLFDNSSLQLYKGQKVGLVGQNGAGKTSLFKMILGKIAPDAGDFGLNADTLIGYVEQEIELLDLPIVDYVLSVHPLIKNDQTDLPEFYRLRPAAEKLLINLGFELHELYLPISNFSGGWQMRANLAKALFIPSDLLLLDEPTNHLDLETVIWLEDWLKSYTGLAIIISHDREFLDNVTTHTVAVSGKKLTLYGGNYSTFEEVRYFQLEQHNKLVTKSEQKIEKLQGFVDKFKAKASKAKQAQSKMKMIEKLKVTESMPRDIDYSIEFLEPIHQINKILSVDDASFGYPGKELISHVKVDIFQGNRIGLLGRNGMGKSTLIKGLIDKTTVLSGEVSLDSKIEVGYFAQHTVEQLDGEDTPLSFIAREHKNKKEGEIRSYLGRYGFNGNKIKESIKFFSGGEKARLTIANIILHQPNILFLDEPTNHLDMQMREELASSLQEFLGAVVIVSHDKFLLQSVVDDFYLIKNGMLTQFNGDLEDYHQDLLTENSQTEKSAKKNKSGKKSKNKIEVITKNDTDKELQALDRQIVALTKQITDMEKQMNSFDLSAGDEFERLSVKCTKSTEELAVLENKWLELEQAANNT